MFRVLIAEDEKLVRIGLKNSVDWEKFDMTVVADEPDGLAALNAYEREKPDLIITDLKMPVMGGMELISRIREKDKDTKIIILTCLEEFSLLRSAMNLNISGYIIKLTMTDEEIENALGKVCEELKARQNIHFGNHIVKNGIDLVKDKIFTDFMFYQSSSEADFDAQVKELKIRIKPDRLLLCILEIDHFRKLRSLFHDEKERLIASSMLNLIKEILAGHDSGEVFKYSDSKYVLVFNSKETASESVQHDEMFHILDKIRKSIDKYLNISVSFGVSSVKTGYGALKCLFEQADKALENKFFNGPGIFFFKDGLNKKSKLEEKSRILYDLVNLIELPDDAFKMKYEDKVNTLLESAADSKMQIQDVFCGLVQWTASYFQVPDSAIELTVLCSKEIQTSETFEDITAALRNFFSGIKSSIKRKKALSSEIARAIEYIDQHYTKNISLQQVAEHVNFSASYLSTLFKKELNVNFIDYLNELRIEKAKKLLIDTYLKSYEVAEKVGFSDNTYFSKAFKRYMGMNPSEFRKQWGKEWVEESYVNKIIYE